MKNKFKNTNEAVKLLILSVVLNFTLINSTYSQINLEQFRKIENSVKYSNPDSLFHLAKKLDTKEHNGLAFKHWIEGRAHFWNSNFSDAYESLERSAELLTKNRDFELLAHLQLDLAASLTIVEQNGRALSYLLEANKYFTDHNNTKQVVLSSIALGEMYRKVAEFKTAHRILYNVKRIAKKDSYPLALCLNRIAAVHSETGSLDSSLFYSHKALKIANHINDPDLIATSENEIGYILRIKGKYEEALPHFYRADSLWRSVGMVRHAINAMHHISVCYGSIDELVKSVAITHKALNLIKGKNWYQIEVSLYEDLRNLQKQLGNSDSSVYYEIKFLETGNLLKDQQYSMNTKMVEVLFTQKQNEQIIHEQEILLENEKLEKVAIRKNQELLILLACLIFLILVSIAIFSIKQRRQQKILKEEYRLKQIQNSKLKEAVAANEILLQEVSHRVKNNLAVLSSLLQLQVNRTTNNIVSSELKEAMLRVDSISAIHKQLYDGKGDAKISLTEGIKTLTDNILNSMGFVAEECVELNLDEIVLDISQSVTLSLILNEVITNSCKYGKIDERHKLVIDLKLKENKIICSVKDRGLGFDSSEGSKNSEGLGLYLIELMSKQLKASISWKKSTNFFIFKIQFYITDVE